MFFSNPHPNPPRKGEGVLATNIILSPPSPLRGGIEGGGIIIKAGGVREKHGWG